VSVNWIQVALCGMNAASGVWFAVSGNPKLGGVALCYAVASLLLAFLEG